MNVVEVWGRPAGILIEEEQGFRLLAIPSLFTGLSGRLYATRGHARIAAIRLHQEAQL